MPVLGMRGNGERACLNDERRKTFELPGEAANAKKPCERRQDRQGYRGGGESRYLSARAWRSVSGPD